jgi:hypothetical protein
MLADGMPLETAVKYTGVPKEEAEAIAKRIKH